MKAILNLTKPVKYFGILLFCLYLNSCQSFHSIEHCLKGDEIFTTRYYKESQKIENDIVYFHRYNGFGDVYNIELREIHNYRKNTYLEKLIIRTNNHDSSFYQDTIIAKSFDYKSYTTNNYKYLLFSKGLYYKYCDSVYKYSSGILLFQKDSPAKYAVVEYSEKEIVYVEQNGENIDVITVELEYSEPYITQMINSFAPRIYKGEYLSKEIYAKHRINRKLVQISTSAVSSKEVEELIKACR